MQNLNIKDMEELLSSSPEQQFKIIEKLPPGSSNKEYLTIMQEIKGGGDWKVMRAKIVAYEARRDVDYNTKNKMKVLRIVRDMENATGEEEVKKAMGEINRQFWNYSFSYSKPAQAKTMNVEVGEDEDNQKRNAVLVESLTPTKRLVETFLKNKTKYNFDQLNTLDFLVSLDFKSLGKVGDLPVELMRTLMQSLQSLDWKLVSLTNFRVFFEQSMALEWTEVRSDLKNQLMALFKSMPLNWIEKYLKDQRWKNFDTLIFSVLEKRLGFDARNRRGLDLEQLEEIKEVLVSMNHPKLKSMLNEVNLELLEKHVQVGSYQPQLFAEHLKNTPVSAIISDSYRYNENYRGQAREHRKNGTGNPGNFNSTRNGRVIDSYLKFLFKDAKDTKAFETNFNKIYLERTFAEVKLLKGENVANVQAILGAGRVKSLTEMKVLEILSWNKKNFAPKDPVQVLVRLKNVEEVKIKIFQINLEQALLKDSNMDYAKMDLLGLVAKEEYNYKYDKQPLEQWDEQFSFESIQNQKRGVFIIDFIAGRSSSRAVINKGQLTLLTEKQKLGTSCVILDEDKNICLGGKTGLYIRGKFYPTDAEGVVYLPNNDTGLSGEVIMIHDTFACVGRVEVSSPNLQLTMDVQINKEQLRPGNEITVLLLPKLLLYSEPLCLSNLKDVNLMIDLVSDLGATQTIEFNKKNNNAVKLRQGGFTPLNINFPPKTVRLSVRLTAEVELHGKDKRSLNASQNYSFMRAEQRKMAQLYLNYDQEKGYLAQVRGCNGERLGNKNIRIEVDQKMLSSSNKSSNLVVDGSGTQALGQLEGSEKLTITLDGRRETIRKRGKHQTKHYSRNVMLVEGEGLELPIGSSNEFGLLKLADKAANNLEFYTSRQVVEDLTADKSRVKFGDQKVRITGLEAGWYNIRIGDEILIVVKVFEGERFNLESRQYIKTKKQIIQAPAAYQFWRVFKNCESNKLRLVKGSLLSQQTLSGGDSNNPVDKYFNKAGKVEAVLMCHTFIDESSGRLSSGNKNNEREFRMRYEMTQNDNKYLNNKKLDEEILYVLRRKNQQEFVGNTLEKPTMLLKREKNQETTQDNEILKEARDLYGSARNQMGSCARAPSSRCNMARLDDLIDLSTGFLKQPGTIITSGLSLDERNNLVVNEELIRNYNHVYVLFNLDNQVILTETLKSTADEPVKNNLSLEESKKPGYVYRNIRQIKNVKGGESLDVENVDKAEFTVIKSLVDLNTTIHAVNNSFSGPLKEWEFLAKWMSLEPLEKLKKYDKFYSHELNVFLFFKDTEFFANVVKPHLQNKHEKQVIDYFLLGDKAKLSEYLNMGKMHNLQVLETIFVLMGCWDDPRARQLAEGLKKKFELPQLKVSDEQFKNLFDKVLQSAPEEEFAVQNVVKQSKKKKKKWGGRGGMKKESMQRIERCMEVPQMMMRCAPAPEMMMDDCMMMEEEEKCIDFASGSQQQSYNDNSFRQAAQEVYKGVESTTEYVEKQFYFQHPILSESKFYSNLVLHYLENGSLKNFLDQNFLFCSQCPTEYIFMLAFLDLSFENVKPETQLNNNVLTLKPKNNNIIFMKEISEIEGNQLDLGFLVSQRFYDPQDRYAYLEDGTRTEKRVQEFCKGKVYGCRVVVTNPTVSDHKISVVTEIPQGAIQIRRPDALKTHPLMIQSFRSQVIDYEFYFPENGNYNIFPATVSKNVQILATAPQDVIIRVGEKVERKEMESMTDVLSSGKLNLILDFLRKKNLSNPAIVNSSQICWLLTNKSIYKDILAIYREQGVFDTSVWSFSILHGDMKAFEELAGTQKFGSNFTYFTSKFGTVDSWKTKDYFPLINPRAHNVDNQSSNILNRQFKQTYQTFLQYLIQKSFFNAVTNEDRLLWVTYLLLQDRVAEAGERFKELKKQVGEDDDINTKIQRDYIEAYLDFMTGYPDFTKSKAICQKYLSYTVITWRNLFVEIANQLAEYEALDFETEGQDSEEKGKTRAQKADESPHLAAELTEDKKIKLSYKNQRFVNLEYYTIDLEILFSQDPFEEKLNSSLTHILPFLTQTQVLDFSSDFESKIIEVPTALRTQNLMIRVVDESRESAVLKYIPFQLQSSLNERFGILKLIDPKTRKPVPKIYVKCFSRSKSGQTKFYKDGYTDIRGSFDFAAVSSNNADNAEVFKLLAISPQFGAKVFTAKPPVASSKSDVFAKAIRSNNWRQLTRNNARKDIYSQVASQL